MDGLFQLGDLRGEGKVVTQPFVARKEEGTEFVRVDESASGEGEAKGDSGGHVGMCYLQHTFASSFGLNLAVCTTD